MKEGRGSQRTALQRLNQKGNNDMLRRGNAVHFKCLGNLACADDEGLGETTLAGWRIETVCDEKRVFGELGTPCDDGRHECGMQSLLWVRTRRRGTARVDGCILRNVHVQTSAKVRRVEEWETRMHDLEVDLDEVKCESEDGRRAGHG